MTIEKITKDDVIALYRDLLGRAPETDETIAYCQTFPSMEELTSMIKRSKEYQNRVSNASSQHVADTHNFLDNKDIDFSKRWLVISNCQTHGLMNCLSLICPGIEVDSVNFNVFMNQIEPWLTRLPKYAQVIVGQDIKWYKVPDLDQHAKITWIPNITFFGYHPDLCSLMKDETLLKGPLDEYHSIIVYAAFRNGLSVEQTKALFRHETYEALGYYDVWDSAKERMLKIFSDCGLDISHLWNGWVRQGCFMHSVNHPKIHVLYDVAVLIAQKLKQPIYTNKVLPHDNLAVGPIFPIYPELAEHLSLDDGSYYFKPLAKYKLITLDEVIEESFKAYKDYAEDELNSHPAFKATIEKAIQYIVKAK